MAYEDLSGKRFQNLEVLKQADDYVGPSGRHERMWQCKCLLCGDVIVTRERNLKSGHVKSCGKKHRRVEDLKGKQFHDLKVIERAPNTYSGKSSYVMWRCKCQCGREVVVRAASLKNGHTRSCGRCSRSKSNMGKGLDDISNKEFGYWTVLSKSRSIIQPNGKRVTLWKCQCRCGEIREIRAGTLKSGLSYSCGCHKVKMLAEKASKGFGISKSEKFVSDVLKDKQIYYEPQKIYSDLRGDSGYPLSYDFLIYNDIFEPVFLIECQGKQHYEPIGYFGGEERFETQKRNDEYKKLYADKINLPLLEIPYWYSSEETLQALDIMFSKYIKCSV